MDIRDCNRNIVYEFSQEIQLVTKNIKISDMLTCMDVYTHALKIFM